MMVKQPPWQKHRGGGIYPAVDRQRSSHLYKMFSAKKIRLHILPSRMAVIVARAKRNRLASSQCHIVRLHSLCRLPFAQAKCDVPCSHGAVCVAPDTCECKHGSHGRYCEKFKCRSKCLNGGACVGPNRCKCPPNYGGALCHKALCPSPCKNGGRCSDGRCICPAGFQGQTCEKRQCVMSTISQSFRRGYSQLSKHRVAVSCGPWRPRHACYQLKKSYKMIYRTFYRTVYVCGKDHFSADTNI